MSCYLAWCLSLHRVCGCPGIQCKSALRRPRTQKRKTQRQVSLTVNRISYILVDSLTVKETVSGPARTVGEFYRGLAVVTFTLTLLDSRIHTWPIGQGKDESSSKVKETTGLVNAWK